MFKILIIISKLKGKILRLPQNLKYVQFFFFNSQNCLDFFQNSTIFGRNFFKNLTQQFFKSFAIFEKKSHPKIMLQIQKFVVIILLKCTQISF